MPFAGGYFWYFARQRDTKSVCCCRHRLSLAGTGPPVTDVWADSGAIQPVGHDRKQYFPSSTYRPSALARLIRIRRNSHDDSRKGKTMKKPLLSIDEPEPKKASRADRPPTEGFATVVDGHFKSA